MKDDQLEKLSIRMAVATSGLSFKTANSGEKLSAIVKQTGKEKILAMLCVSLKLFSHGIRSNDKLRNSEIVELANDILEMYKYDSFEDIQLALKRSAYKGEKFYHGLDKGKVFSILSDYFADKADWRADEEYRKKKDYEKVEIPKDATPEFIEGINKVKQVISATASKKVSIKDSLNTSQSYFQSQLIDQLPFMTLPQLHEAKKSYQKQSALDFAKEISWIDDEIKLRQEAA